MYFFSIFWFSTTMRNNSKVFVSVVLSTMVLSIIGMTTTIESIYADHEDGFSEELELLNQSLTSLQNQDKKAAKTTLFDAEELMEDLPNKDVETAKKRVEAGIKMVNEDDFTSAISHTQEAIKTLSKLKWNYRKWETSILFFHQFYIISFNEKYTTYQNKFFVKVESSM